ncbi:HEPN domain-containing protein [Arsenicibacter rosenii]|uniref:HEPN domain-containing protein n=1 Tax=Arsenicibacter rosenii TaxID=1750698 RepID=A0A1S2VRE5_9BACT|nr:HEPN domain-containing protein [Arsenicibacter rosenii]OIN60388.1 hypothetical protein BLX24_06070 [Arsenicibacter rosenii]
MLLKSELKRIATARLQDARLLLDNHRYDSAAYLCGYALELKLKYRICISLHWDGFPETNNEFNGLQSFRTHDLTLLLKLSGRQAMIQRELFTEWSLVSLWRPEFRHSRIGTQTQQSARTMIEAVQILLRKL